MKKPPLGAAFLSLVGASLLANGVSLWQRRVGSTPLPLPNPLPEGRGDRSVCPGVSALAGYHEVSDWRQNLSRHGQAPLSLKGEGPFGVLGYFGVSRLLRSFRLTPRPLSVRTSPLSLKGEGPFGVLGYFGVSRLLRSFRLAPKPFSARTSSLSLQGEGWGEGALSKCLPRTPFASKLAPTAP